MSHDSVTELLFDDRRKLTKTEWLAVLEARKNSLLHHFKELGQIKLR